MDAKPTVYEDFADKVGQTFTVLGLGEVTPKLTLKKAELLPVYPGAPAALRPPFSLIFEGSPDMVLPQQMYEIESAGGRPIAIFMVPIGRNAEATSYQVIFN